MKNKMTIIMLRKMILILKKRNKKQKAEQIVRLLLTLIDFVLVKALHQIYLNNL